MLLLTAGTVSADHGRWYDLPDWGGDGDAYMHNYGDPSGANSWYFDATIQWVNNPGGYCTYVQYQNTATAALNGGWKRLTHNNCGSTRLQARYSVQAFLNYNGVRFKMCHDRPITTGPDTCGSPSTNIGGAT